MKPSPEALAAARQAFDRAGYTEASPNWIQDAEVQIALAIDHAVENERERLWVAVKRMKYDNLWGGQRRIGWELGKDQALEIIKANDDDDAQAEGKRLTEAARAQGVREGIEMAASSHQSLAGNPELRKKEADLIRALAAPQTQDEAGVRASECG